MGVLGNPLHERFCQELHKLLWAGGHLGDSRTKAYELAGFESNETCRAPNARKLCQNTKVKARLDELATRAATLATLDSGWALMQLAADAEAIKSFNLDNYLSPPDEEGNRYYDLALVGPKELALLTELSTETSVELGDEEKGTKDRKIHKIKLKGPNKYPERVAIIALMARIAGWEAPKKTALTDPTGTKNPTMTLEGLVAASFAAQAPADEKASG